MRFRVDFLKSLIREAVVTDFAAVRAMRALREFEKTGTVPDVDKRTLNAMQRAIEDAGMWNEKVSDVFRTLSGKWLQSSMQHGFDDFDRAEKEALAEVDRVREECRKDARMFFNFAAMRGMHRSTNPLLALSSAIQELYYGERDASTSKVEADLLAFARDVTTPAIEAARDFEGRYQDILIRFKGTPSVAANDGLKAAREERHQWDRVADVFEAFARTPNWKRNAG